MSLDSSHACGSYISTHKVIYRYTVDNPQYKLCVQSQIRNYFLSGKSKQNNMIVQRELTYSLYQFPIDSKYVGVIISGIYCTLL